MKHRGIRVYPHLKEANFPKYSFVCVCRCFPPLSLIISPIKGGVEYTNDNVLLYLHVQFDWFAVRLFKTFIVLLSLFVTFVITSVRLQGLC